MGEIFDIYIRNLFNDQPDWLRLGLLTLFCSPGSAKLYYGLVTSEMGAWYLLKKKEITIRGSSLELILWRLRIYVSKRGEEMWPVLVDSGGCHPFLIDASGMIFL